MTNQNKKTQTLAICAVMVALGVALSFLKLWESPLGGAVTLFSMTPIMLIGFMYGPSWGFGSAFVYAVLQLLFGLSNVAYVPTPAGIVACIMLDYIVPFTLIGITGLFKKDEVKVPRVIVGSLTACLLRFLSHFFCGGIIWYEITKNGAWNELVFKYSKWVYSLIYQLMYLLPETVLVLVATPVIAMMIKRIGRK